MEVWIGLIARGADGLADVKRDVGLTPLALPCDVADPTSVFVATDEASEHRVKSLRNNDLVQQHPPPS